MLWNCHDLPFLLLRFNFFICKMIIVFDGQIDQIAYYWPDSVNTVKSFPLAAHLVFSPWLGCHKHAMQFLIPRKSSNKTYFLVRGGRGCTLFSFQNNDRSRKKNPQQKQTKTEANQNRKIHPCWRRWGKRSAPTTFEGVFSPDFVALYIIRDFTTDTWRREAGWCWQAEPSKGSV